jgi:tetratricopeptide (TPR) repeat protein
MSPKRSRILTGLIAAFLAATSVAGPKATESKAEAPRSRSEAATPSPAAAAPSSRKPHPAPSTAAEAAARLRALYFTRDFVAGRDEGARLAAEHPESSELRAWFLMHRAQNWLDRDGPAAEAEKWVKAWPRDPWAWFAFAGTLQQSYERHPEALPASRKALSLAPSHPDFVWLRASVLSGQGGFTEAIEFIDRVREKSPNPAELLVQRGDALWRRAHRDKEPETAMEDAALRDYAEARRLDPRSIDAYARPGEILVYSHRAAEAYPLLRKAVELAPLSGSVHGLYYQAILGLPDWSFDRKRAEIETNMKILLRERGDNPEILANLAYCYGDIGRKEKKRELEDRALRLDPEGLQSEWILVGRWREYAEEGGEEGSKDPKRRAAYRKMLRDFIARPQHRFEGFLGEAYMDLFLSFEDDLAVDGDQLLEAVQGMVKHEKTNRHITEVAGPIALADRKIYLEEAEAIVRAGIERNREEGRDRGRAWRYQGRKGQKQWARTMHGQLLDALGWVHFNQGRIDEAERELAEALTLAPGRKETLVHRGKVYEATGDLPKAEQSYIKAARVQTPGENPAEKALEALYRKRNGSMEGFAAYREGLSGDDQAKRRERILSGRIAAPQPVAAFSLKTLEGKRVSAADLRGKVGVISFWGLWCGWCLEEMPDFQKLHRQYRNDPGVAVLTLDNDPNPDSVREWMQKKQFDFPVLLDDGYVRKVGVQAFPTTWFLDREGRIAFVQEGWSQHLVEEFGWRIEALKE